MGIQEWFGAIASGNYNQIEQLTSDMAGTRNHLGETALMIAVRLGDNRAVKILEPFESGILNAQNETALMIAVNCNNIIAAKILVNAEYCITKPDGTTALHLATQLGHTHFIDILEPYLRHTADKSGALALSDARLLQSSSLNLNAFDSFKVKSGDAIVSSNIFKQRASGLQLTDSFSNYLCSSVQSKQQQLLSKESAVLLTDVNNISNDPSLHHSVVTSKGKQSTRSTPRLASQVRIEMAEIEDIMITDCSNSIHQSESIKECTLDPIVCDVCNNSINNASDNSLLLLNEASSAKREYVHAQLQYSKVLNALESLYQVPSCIALPSEPHLSNSSNDKITIGLSLLLIVNPFVREEMSHMFDSVEKVRFRVPVAVEHLVYMLGTTHTTDLPIIFICVVPNLVSAIVPCRGTLQIEDTLSKLSSVGVFAALLSPLVKERYACFAESFSSRSMPHAGHLCDKRYIYVHKITREEIHKLYQQSLSVCTVYPLADLETAKVVSASTAHITSKDPLSKCSSNFLIQVSGASEAESLLLCLTFSGYKASFLSFYDFTEIDLPDEIFI